MDPLSTWLSRSETNYQGSHPSYGPLYCGPSPSLPPNQAVPLEPLGPLDLPRTLANRDPLMCECARTGKRPLSWASWIPGFSGGSPFFDRRNLEFSHEHILFEGTGDNIGFGPDGTYQEDVSAYRYRWDKECYDGSQMREALGQVTISRGYNFFTHNCQDFVEKVRSIYRQLKAS